MIVYRKSSQLRIKRSAAPEPPFWCATSVAPYSARRAAPIAIDYLELRASSTERLEVNVCDRTRDELERTSARLAQPVLVEASEFAEAIFRRGEEVLDFCTGQNLAAVHLVSTRGALPEKQHADMTLVIAAWPLDFDRFEELCGGAHGSWGIAVPVLFPVTTDLVALQEIAALAKTKGAQFLASIPVEIDATAKQAIAQSLSLDGDHETYAALFHSNLDPVHVATERHIAALAAEAGLADHVVVPRSDEETNWNAAIMLTMTATRMLAMEHEIDLAALLARSARAVAELDKPLTRIAEAASLSIVGALDDVSVDVLSEWLDGKEPTFVRRINERWRLRRDVR
ncbi:MAG TPA: hypothetical protein VF980_21270 [Thermoanaerobaculia bacterium]